MYNEKLEQIVEELHQKMGVKSIPVPVEKIAEKLGIKIKRAPSEDFSGLLLRKDGKALIGVNSTESEVRQRFTIAHELGHFFLHKTQEAFVDYRNNQTGAPRSLKERNADTFAAAFLIPRSSLSLEVKKIGKEGIFESEVHLLAKKYAVSKEAMNYRLLNLGLFSRK